ncbi:GNAT family N-acetyltransferase [Paenibacillus pinisoli]|uniref:GNAT family N-acetyltransferase n=1 Tax=Paenibacillus pinisoli TaxID=1276110 RepID=A0A3A6PQE5_9BACL|nr:GNAT family N-acetyltransferase [Paenibacillus pinisoli]RJX38831.1 GNAT family N-acetyltransferase [Paenibacillus pinisoli]
MEKLVIERVTAGNPGLAALIRELDRYLEGLYPPEEIFVVDFDDPKTSEMVFVMAYGDGEPAGCAGLRQLDGESVELKRFYVDPRMRRHGVARQLYQYLEQQALELGCSIIRLETGAPQVEAIAFYKKLGFYEIPAFGEYIGCASSLCMEKRIG